MSEFSAPDAAPHPPRALRQRPTRRVRERAPAVDPRILRSKVRMAAALVSLLQTRELDEIIVRDIAETSKVGYTTFYRHYETKEDLVSEIAAVETDKLADLVFPKVLTGESFDAALFSSHLIASQRPVWYALTSRLCAATLREKLVDSMLRHANGLTMGSTLFPREMTASLAATILVEVMTWWLRGSGDAPPELLAQAIDRTIIKPALTNW